MPDLFVGVVSHHGSRFALSQGPRGLAAQLAEQMAAVVVRVNTEDLLDEGTQPVTPAMVQDTLTAELRLERGWARYLGRSMGVGWWSLHAIRWFRRSWRRVRPPSVSMVKRLLNIELSHLDLMRRGLASGAPWILVLEDDAVSDDVTDLVAGLRGLMSSPADPAFVNLSQSFSIYELGVDHLLSPSGARWAGSTQRAVLAADRPVTNTVCAILYSASFLAQLLHALDGLPMEPVVPIDWKLNRALMAIFEAGHIDPGACWLVEPAPITQMSMQPAGILPS